MNDPIDLLPSWHERVAALKKQRAALVKVLKAIRDRCPGVHQTDQHTGRTFAELADIVFTLMTDEVGRLQKGVTVGVAMCDVCAGTGLLLDNERCGICSGTGSSAEEKVGLRTECFALREKRDKMVEALREIEDFEPTQHRGQIDYVDAFNQLQSKARAALTGVQS